jgi:hypothetical protein
MAATLDTPEETGADGAILPIHWGVFHRRRLKTATPCGLAVSLDRPVKSGSKAANHFSNISPCQNRKGATS